MATQIKPSRFFLCIILGFCMGLLSCSDGMQSNHDQNSPMTSDVQKFDSKSTFYSFKVKDIDGWLTSLSRYEGKVILVVNVASDCRFTEQYENLQRLFMKYRNQGFVVLGFPANNFGNQEPGSNAEIKEFVANRFNVTFPMFSKISVKGKYTHPLYQYLTSPEANNEFGGPITWNFNKFLIDKDGKTIARFPSKIDPLDPQITEAIEAELE